MQFENHEHLVDCEAFKTSPVLADIGFLNTNNDSQLKNAIALWLNCVALGIRVDTSSMPYLEIIGNFLIIFANIVFSSSCLNICE